MEAWLLMASLFVSEVERRLGRHSSRLHRQGVALRLHRSCLLLGP